MNNVPFWWVVKHRDGGYLGEHVDKHVQHQREAGRHMVRGDAAGFAAWWDNNTHRVVKVHARIPEPKLPAWAKLGRLGPEQVCVVRVVDPRLMIKSWTFHVAENGELAPLWKRAHIPSDPNMDNGDIRSAPPDVWAEAAARAARMLRARKAGK